ncbi:MAG: hypothetical protein DRP85_01915 [Candidatus Makaraimicrobium thalassicum]|nr:MAG: hypothetical protein DRP85_01915 [Candidatus Omnitrophota bacterium]
MSDMKNDLGGFADLHVHTIYSDGIFTPEMVVRKAIELGLRGVAITDHDCIDGVSPGVEAAGGSGPEIVPGVEITAAKDGTEIHILGYFIDCEDPFFLETLRAMQKKRAGRMKKMLHLLSRQGMDLSMDRVLGTVSKGTVGRLHLARVMAEENMTKNIKEAFDRYIGDGKPCCVRHEHLDYREAIGMIRRAGGVPVLAHPGTTGKDEDIPSYVQAGLAGVEAFHSRHRPAMSEKYLALANRYGLLVTGGSDCHGMKKGGSLMGKVRVSYEVVENLRAEAKKIGGGNRET